MANKEDMVFGLLRGNDNLWVKVFEELTDREIGGYIPAGDLIPWVDKQLYRPVLLKGIEAGEYQWSIARKVYLIKPGSAKKRVVYIYSHRDRLVQALLCRAVATVYDHKVHPKCYSYRLGVSTVSAVKDVFSQISNKNMHAMKLDISSYFYNVRRGDIMKQLDSLFDINGSIHKLLTRLYSDDRIFDRREQEDRDVNEYEVNVAEAMHGSKGRNHILKEEYKSLIAGSSLSGFMSNCLLYGLDEFISSIPGVVYARYCDDILVAHESKESLIKVFELIQKHLTSLGLEVNEKKVNWYEQGDTITFLGIQAFIRDDKRVFDVGLDTVTKLKKFIKQSASKARSKIEKKKLTGVKKELVMVKLVMKINYLLYKCYIEDKRKFGWAYYAFRCINITLFDRHSRMFS